MAAAIAAQSSDRNENFNIIIEPTDSVFVKSAASTTVLRMLVSTKSMEFRIVNRQGGAPGDFG
jgi:hypothetical protein